MAIPSTISPSTVNSVLLLGGGGHCRSVIEVLASQVSFRPLGILDSTLPAGTLISEVPVLGTDDYLDQLKPNSLHYFLVTIGQVGPISIRPRVFEAVKNKGIIPATIVAQTALVSARASIGHGTVVMHQCLVNTGAIIGKNCILNTGCLIEHDAVIGDHCHISTRSTINGDCRIGRCVMVGSGAIVKHSLTICSDVVIGAGAVVVNDVDEPGIYVGNPARRLN